MSTTITTIVSLSELLESFYNALAEDHLPRRKQSLASLPECPPLDRLVELFHLTTFERNLLLFCAGMEIDPRFADLLTILDPSPEPANRKTPTFSFALAALPESHWTALAPDRPLYRWQLLHISHGESLLHGSLRIDTRILLYLLDVPSSDEQLLPYIHSTGAPADELMSSHALELGCQYWLHPPSHGEVLRPLLLIARHEETRLAMAHSIAREAGFRLATLRAADIPIGTVDREQLARRWSREALLSGSALYIQTSENDRPDEQAALQAFTQALKVPVALGLSEDGVGTISNGLRIYEEQTTSEDRRRLWKQYLGPLALSMNGHLDALADQFDLPATQIQFAASLACIAANGSEDPAHKSGKYASQLAKDAARQPLHRLARRIQPNASWDDLVLPRAQKEAMQRIILNVQQRRKVYNDWGFGGTSARGLAVTALFSGPSGTGKTMAAEIIAAALELDLYQIDLSTLVSKYIGETEKNLSRIFDAAEQSGAVLLFDEADSLFSKRTEVSDSHDRYANLEVSYLLQRMESYRGVAILTTNMKHALDPAFVRRIRFFVNFPFPDAACRSAIWRGIFPDEAPLESLDYDVLAQLNIPGGIIRNIALQSAFFAAKDNQPIGMHHLLMAARGEYDKLNRPLAPTELRGWE